MASNFKPSITFNILQSYYPIVTTLQDYLYEVMESPGPALCTVLEDASACTLLTKSYACLSGEKPIGGTRRLRAAEPIIPIREIIDRAQERLFMKSKGRPNNIITSGYRNASRNNEATKLSGGRVPISNYFINTIVTALQGSEWETLFHAIGEDVMFHLLTEVSIFVPLPNDCLCQVTGEPILHMKTPRFFTNRVRDEAHSRHSNGNGAFQNPQSEARGVKRKLPVGSLDERVVKRLKTGGISSTSSSFADKNPTQVKTLQKRTPADVTFVRARMFYARPFYAAHASKIVVGFPPKHVLHQLAPPSYGHKTQHQPDPDPRKQMENARHLSKYVFPRQYGLSNPHTIVAERRFETFQLPDFGDREAEIERLGKCKTPKRVKPALDMLEKMIWRHGKCAYKALLEMACPSKILKANKTPLESSIILEMMSENSIQLRSQPSLSINNTSVDSAGNTIIARGLSQAQKHLRHKPRFAEFACAYAEVHRFAVLVTKAVIPNGFWGCSKNLDLVLHNVLNFISARRYESMTLHYALQGFSTSECDWLAGEESRAPRVSVSDSLKRRELIEEFMFWYFDSFLLPLMKTTFYVTESSAFRNRILYFRQDDWSTLCAPLIEKLSSDTFQKLEQREAEEMLRQRKLGFSFVRLLPKENGVRPIVNLKRKKVAQKSFHRGQQSINQILQAAFHILTYEKESQSKRLGASVFGANEVYAKLKAYKAHLTSMNSSERLPKLYFVKVDVQACFDSIEQTKLLEIIRELLSEDAYMMQRYGQICAVGPKVRRTYAKKAHPEDDHPDFLTYAAKLAEVLRHTIFVDQVVYSFEKKQEILALLEEHVTENIVKIGHDYYRQMVGIPQGSVLSALLCSFFYGDLERERLKFAHDPSNLLLRLIDDYLFVTTSLPRAQHFLEVMNKGHPEYGCFISRDKTLTNFPYGDLMNVVLPQQKVFPWCGFMINMSDLSVSFDCGRYHSTYLQDSLTVDTGRRAGVVFVHKMLQLAKSKSHVIYTDADLNSEHTVYLNIYQNFILSAMKMHYYLRTWGISVKQRSSFVHSTVKQMIHFTFATIRSKAGNKVAKANGGRCVVQQGPVLWLGSHAFHAVLSHKPGMYPQLLKALEFDLALPRNRHYKKQYRAVVKEGRALFSLLSF